MTEFEDDQPRQLTVGERLREAREAKGVTLDEIASQTRIPVRHLQHIETGDWEALPAVTYSVGFARSYANAVGLDGAEIGAEVRQQLGSGRRPGVAPAEYYEPADPARVPPRWLVITAAIIAVLLIAGYLVFRSNVDDGGEVAAPAEQAAQPAQPAAAQPAQQPQNVAGQPVVLAATEEVWLRVYDGGGRKLFEGILQPGQQYQVPAGVERPQLTTGRANALRVTVGQTVIPPLGPPERRISDVSLRAEDLIARAQGGTPAAPPAAPRPGAR